MGTFFLALIFLAHFLLNHVHSCQLGWYQNSGEWSKCPDSWRTCTDSTSWTTWESFMFLNHTTNLCQFCQDGEFYDSTFEEWRSWDGIWTGLWRYQTHWLSCASGEVFDTLTLTWKSSCPFDTWEVSHSQYSIQSIWRGYEFYIDSSSAQLMEFGTIDYPYKTLKPVFIEVLNHLSNQQVDIKINLKQNTQYYLEDDVSYLINISSVTFDSYSDNGTVDSRAKIIPTRMQQIELWAKSAFCIIKDSTLLLNEVIGNSSLTDYEKELIGSQTVTITPVRTSVHLYNIDVIREYIDYFYTSVFMNPIYLQENWIDYQNATFNVTGILLASVDPLNINLENLIVDAYGLRNGIVFRTVWNYPEASLNNIVTIKNYTVVTTSDRQFIDNPSMFYYAGTGNVSASDINFDDNYITIFNPKGSFYVTVTADCQPEDGEFRTVDLENATFSNPNNANIDRYNLLGIIFHLNMYRRIAVNITNIEFHDFEKTATHMIMAYGAFSDTFYASNIRYTNVEGNYQFNHIQLWQQVTLQNIEFNGITSNFDVSAILAEYNLYFKIHNISFINSNGTASFTSGLIELNNLPQTFTEITELSVEDSYLRHRKAVRNLQTLNSLTLTNWVFENIHQSTDGVLISTGTVGRINFKNHTFSNIISVDESDETSVIYRISSLYLSVGLNSTLTEVKIEQSSASILSFGGFTGSTTASTFTVNNVSYSNSYFTNRKSLISTESLSTESDFVLKFDNLRFLNISFFYNGYMFDFKHLLPNPVVVSNSTFNMLEAAMIRLESSDKNGVFETYSILQESTFDNINEKYNSLINLFEGARLEISGWNFTNIFTYEEAAVLYGGYRNSISLIEDSYFSNNSAASGALFYAESSSQIYWSRCKIYNNYANSASVMFSSGNGFFVFEEWDVHDNYAIEYPFASFLDSVDENIMTNCTFYNNSAFTKEQVIAEVDNWSYLCFLQPEFVNNVMTQNAFDKVVFKQELIQQISSSLRISEGTVIQNQGKMFVSLLSDIVIEDSFISNITLIHHGIQIVSSTFTLRNVTVENISSPIGFDFILALLDWEVSMNEIRYTSSSSRFLRLRTSELNASNITFFSISSPSTLISLSNSKQVNVGKLRSLSNR